MTDYEPSAPFVEIPLVGGAVTLVDEADAEAATRFRWRARRHRNTSYAVRPLRYSDGRRGRDYLHRLLTGWSLVDHINGDGLDNRRTNLREATNAQNLYNQRPRAASSRFKGVCWYRRDRIWVATIHPHGRAIYLGRFTVEEDAARAYDAAAREHFGEFAWLNFPEPGEAVRSGRVVAASSFDHPAAPGGVRLDIGRPRDGVTAVAAREAEALRGADAGVSGAGEAGLPVAASSVPPSHRLANERLRGGWPP